MKKNAMLKIAAILLVAVLLTTCAISSTFAKYVTQGTAQDADSARVAKWGVKFKTSAFTTDDIKEYDFSAKDDDVYFNADDIVIAPGSSNKVTLNTTMEGKAEVAYEIINTGTVALDDWKVGDAFYCPLVFDVNGTEVDVSAMNDEATAEAAVKAQIDLLKKEVPANADPSDYTIYISWKWAFGAEDNKLSGNDEKDVALGNAETAATVSISITQTAVQVN